MSVSMICLVLADDHLNVLYMGLISDDILNNYMGGVGCAQILGDPLKGLGDPTLDRDMRVKNHCLSCHANDCSSNMVSSKGRHPSAWVAFYSSELEICFFFRRKCDEQNKTKNHELLNIPFFYLGKQNNYSCYIKK